MAPRCSVWVGARLPSWAETCTQFMSLLHKDQKRCNRLCPKQPFNRVEMEVGYRLADQRPVRMLIGIKNTTRGRACCAKAAELACGNPLALYPKLKGEGQFAQAGSNCKGSYSGGSCPLQVPPARPLGAWTRPAPGVAPPSSFPSPTVLLSPPPRRGRGQGRGRSTCSSPLTPPSPTSGEGVIWWSNWLLTQPLPSRERG